jgi:uncharacterized RDD family membrane protein YckC
VNSLQQPPDRPAAPSGDRFVDKLTIQTPEQTLLDFPLAGIGSRFLAIALDTLIQALVITVFLIIALVLMAFAGISSETAGVWVSAIAILGLFLIYTGYFAFFEAIWNGQTPGKRLLKLRVIQESGRPINPYQAIARNLMRLVDSLPFLYGVGCLTVLLNRQNKRLGDFVAGTVVVLEKPLIAAHPEWGIARPQTARAYDLRLLADGEFQLIETFLQRRSYLDLAVRQRMAREIAARIVHKLESSGTADKNPGPSDEQFLEDLVRQYRDAGALGR